jgi:hypothetical protein
MKIFKFFVPGTESDGASLDGEERIPTSGACSNRPVMWSLRQWQSISEVCANIRRPPAFSSGSV